MQNLLTKQGPEGAYNIDLHELQKNLSLKLPSDWVEDLEFITQAFSFHYTMKSLYTI